VAECRGTSRSTARIDSRVQFSGKPRTSIISIALEAPVTDSRRTAAAAGSNTATGQQFEKRISALYRQLGFDVVHNTELSSRQVDLVCSRPMPGTGAITVLVECKFKTTGSVSNQEVLDFIATYDGLKHAHSLSSACLVSNQPFTQNAKPETGGARRSLRLVCSMASGHWVAVSSSRRLWIWQDDLLAVRQVQVGHRLPRGLSDQGSVLHEPA